MQTDDSSLLCSMTCMETATSLTLLPEQKINGPRFRRSGSGQRSRSKENCQANENHSFFIKNCFSRQQESHSPDAHHGRDKRRNHHLPQADHPSPSPSPSPLKGSDPVVLTQHCHQLNQLLQKSHSYIVQLQGRIAQLQQERGKNQSVKERARQNRTALAKLRKQIADTRVIEKPPIQVLEQQVKQLQAETLCLKEEVASLKDTIRKQEEQAEHAKTQRELQLEDTILHLRHALHATQKRQSQLKDEMSRIRLRLEKKEDNKNQAKNQELAYLRYRYEKLRRKFEENKKQLQTLERRERSSRYIFGGGPEESPQSHQQRQVSLSLSP